MLGKVALQPVDEFVFKRRDLAILLRRQAFEDRVPGVDDERAGACPGDGADEVAHECVLVDRIDAGAMLDRHRKRDRIAHRRDAVGDQRRLGHQAGAEAPGLHALAGTTDIQVDLVVTPGFAQPRAVRERGGSLPPSCNAIGCSAGSKSRCRGTLPNIIAPVVTISVYKRARGVISRKKKRQ